MPRTFPYLVPNGDASLQVFFGDDISLPILQQVIATQKRLEAEAIVGVIELVPAYASLLLVFDLQETTFYELERLITPLLPTIEIQSLPKLPLIEIPVCYHPSLGLDMDLVAEHCGLLPSEIIERHTTPTYLVYMLGFMPGFLYLGGMDSSLAIPRKQQPRKHTPQGAVGIASEQTGIYPFASPGGWQIIGQTPRVLFDPQRAPVSIAQPLQPVKFIAIGLAGFQAMNRGNR
jgi:KipI family sensor histidine kinase inhibitor